MRDKGSIANMLDVHIQALKYAGDNTAHDG